MVAPARFLRHAQTLAARGISASGCAAAGSAAATADAAAAPGATHVRQAGAMPVTRSFSGAATGLSALRAAGGGGGSSSCSCSGSSIFGTGGSSGPRGNWSSRASSTHASRSAASYAGSSGQPHSSGSSSDDRSGSSSSSSSGRDTPKAQGFRMPGEWEPHAGTWMAFPHDPHLWRAAARPAQQQLAAVARAVAQFEQVWMLVDPQVRAEARAAFRGVSGVELVEAPTNDVWTRDWGPTCLVRDVPSGSSSSGSGSSSGGGRRRREVGALHFDYNCYGAPLKEHPLMPDWSLDRAAGRALPARHPDVVRREHVWRAPPGLHLEGGAVLADGEGTLLVTEECLLHPSRDLPPPAWRRRHPHPLDSLALGRPTDAPAAAAVAAVAAAVAAAEVTGGGAAGGGSALDEAGLGRRVERESRKAAVGEMLCEWLGADKVLWLPHGMAGDEEGTNGHVDNVAAFAAPGVVLLAWCNSPDQDPDQTRLAAENMAALADQTDARGRKLRVVPVPCPLPVLKVTREEAGGAAAVAAAAAAGYGGRMAAGARLPASYINHYIVNGGVVVPLFGGEQRRSDDAALEVLTAVYGGGGGIGGRRVVGVDSREVLLGGGNVHCITQQLPAAWGLAG